MRKRSKFLIATLCLLVLYVLLALAMPIAGDPIVWIIGDKLDWQSRWLAGWNARNCGRVGYDADGGVASECVVNVFREKAPFRVRYETTSIDEASAFAIVGARDGRLYHIAFLSGSPDAVSASYIRTSQLGDAKSPSPSTKRPTGVRIEG